MRCHSAKMAVVLARTEVEAAAPVETPNTESIEGTIQAVHVCRTYLCTACRRILLHQMVSEPSEHFDLLLTFVVIETLSSRSTRKPDESNIVDEAQCAPLFDILEHFVDVTQADSTRFEQPDEIIHDHEQIPRFGHSIAQIPVVETFDNGENVNVQRIRGVFRSRQRFGNRARCRCSPIEMTYRSAPCCSQRSSN